MEEDGFSRLTIGGMVWKGAKLPSSEREEEQAPSAALQGRAEGTQR